MRANNSLPSRCSAPRVHLQHLGGPFAQVGEGACAIPLQTRLVHDARHPRGDVLDEFELTRQRLCSLLLSRDVLHHAKSRSAGCRPPRCGPCACAASVETPSDRSQRNSTVRPSMASRAASQASLSSGWMPPRPLITAQCGPRRQPGQLVQAGRPHHLLVVDRVGPVAHPGQLLDRTVKLHLLLQLPVELAQGHFRFVFPCDFASAPPAAAARVPLPAGWSAGARGASAPRSGTTSGGWGPRAVPPGTFAARPRSANGPAPPRCGPSTCSRAKPKAVHPGVVDGEQTAVALRPAQAHGHGRCHEHRLPGQGCAGW